MIAATLTRYLSELKDNPVRLAELRRNAVATSAKLNWEIESEKGKEFYNKVINENG